MVPPRDEIITQVYRCNHVNFRVFSFLQNLPLTILSIDKIEADDAIAYLSSYFKEKCVILSNDRDFLQLVSDRVGVYLPTKKKMYTPENLLEVFTILIRELNC